MKIEEKLKIYVDSYEYLENIFGKDKPIGIEKYDFEQLKPNLINFLNNFAYNEKKDAVLQKTGLIDDRIDYHNNLVKNIKLGIKKGNQVEYYNPLEIKKELKNNKINDEFKDLDENTNIELIAKTLQWINSTKTGLDKVIEGYLGLNIGSKSSKGSKELREEFNELCGKVTRLKKEVILKKCYEYLNLPDDAKITEKFMKGNQDFNAVLSTMREKYKKVPNKHLVSLIGNYCLAHEMNVIKDNLINVSLYEVAKNPQENTDDFVKLTRRSDLQKGAEDYNTVFGINIDGYSEPFEFHVSGSALDGEVATINKNGYKLNVDETRERRKIKTGIPIMMFPKELEEYNKYLNSLSDVGGGRDAR